MKKKLIHILIATLIVTFGGCAGTPPSSGAPDTTSDIVVYEVPDGVATYESARLKVNGESVPLLATRYNAAQIWSPTADSRTETGFANFDFSGEIEVKIEFDDPASYYVVRPSVYDIDTSVEGNTLTFRLSEPGNYAVQPFDDPAYAIYLFCNEITEPEFTENAPDVVYFGAGLHTAANDPRIGADNVVNVRSNQTIYLAGGAVVRAKIMGNNVSNVRVAGRGVLDGSTFVRDPASGKVTVPVEFNNCSDIKIEDIVLNDPAGWCVQYYFVEGGEIDNVRILSSRSNGDGVSLQSCQDILVRRVFARTWDDSLVVKNYPLWYDRSKQGTTRNITFEYCTLWADLAQCMEVGYETVGETMENVTFRDITVLHAFHKPVMSIHNANNANVRNVTFENITVEDAAMGQGDAGGNSQLVEISVAHSANWSDAHAVTPLGSIGNVRIANVWVYAARTKIRYRIAGCVDTRDPWKGSVHTVSGVIFDGIKIGTKVETMTSADLSINEYASGISFLARPASDITGARVAP